MVPYRVAKLQHNCFLATTSFLMLLEGSIHHARSTVRCFSVPAVACVFGQSTSQLYVLHAGVQCVMHFFPHAWQYDCSSSSWCLMHTSLLDACSMMKAGVGTTHRKTAQRFSAAAAPAWTIFASLWINRNRKSVCLSTLVGLPSSLRLCMGLCQHILYWSLMAVLPGLLQGYL